MNGMWMLITSFRFWTQVVKSISNDDNHNATSTSFIYMYIYVCMCVCVVGVYMICIYIFWNKKMVKKRMKENSIHIKMYRSIPVKEIFGTGMVASRPANLLSQRLDLKSQKAATTTKKK